MKSRFSSPKLFKKLKESFKPAAVIVPLVKRNGEWFLLFTKRTNKVAHHKGEFSFPGGIIEPTDRNAEETALREMEEEVGIPKNGVKIIGALEPVITAVSFYIVYPFIGAIATETEYKINQDEIDRILEVPLDFLLNTKDVRTEVLEYKGMKFKVYFYNYKGDIIWGATGRILRQFLENIGE
ncbi:MAG TPA: CoA pyrophosphatase [bacterium]